MSQSLPRRRARRAGPSPRGPARLARRLARLYGGLALFGVSIALLVRARLGLDPWDVLHQGIADRTGLRLGWVVVIVSLAVLALWIPLRQRPGLGTLSNALLVGIAVNLALDVVPRPGSLAVRGALLAAGIALNAVATAAYIGAGLGPGTRDGLMTGLAALGAPLRVVRTAIEAAVLVAGWLLGGSVGIGTVLFAATIGPLVHVLLPRLTPTPPPPTTPPPPPPTTPDAGAQGPASRKETIAS